jgi:hypothetical protein
MKREFYKLLQQRKVIKSTRQIRVKLSCMEAWRMRYIYKSYRLVVRAHTQRSLSTASQEHLQAVADGTSPSQRGWRLIATSKLTVKRLFMKIDNSSVHCRGKGGVLLSIEAGSDMLYLSKLLDQLGFAQQSPSPVYEDNMECIKWGNNISPFWMTLWVKCFRMSMCLACSQPPNTAS